MTKRHQTFFSWRMRALPHVADSFLRTGCSKETAANARLQKVVGPSVSWHGCWHIGYVIWHHWQMAALRSKDLQSCAQIERWQWYCLLGRGCRWHDVGVRAVGWVWNPGSTSQLYPLLTPWAWGHHCISLVISFHIRKGKQGCGKLKCFWKQHGRCFLIQTTEKANQPGNRLFVDPAASWCHQVLSF